MIADLKPYPTMKDSGVPWLGELPEHWKCHAFRAVATARKGRQPSRLSGPEGAKEGIPYLSMRFLRSTKASASEYATFQSDLVIAEGGDTILLWDGANAGEFLKAKYGVVSSTSSRIVPHATNREFFFYACRIVEPTLRALTVGMGIPHVDGDILKGIRLPVPHLTEQAAIVRFLDYAGRQIRRYIRTKQKLIKLLEEQKQAFIHRAVTRGLDPNVTLKSSGVDWLGDVPEQWEVRRNGRLFAQRNETGFASLPILEVSLRTGVRIRDFESTDRKQVMSDRDKYKRAVSGDIAYNMMRMWQGAVGVAPADGLVSPAYVVAKPLIGTESRYFIRLFRTAVYMTEIDKYSRGIVKDRNRLYWEDFKRMPSCYPPPHEQVMIADAIDHESEEIDATIVRIRREVELLREYHTQLINDVVTGKLDVREAAKNLPDESDEFELLDAVDELIDDGETMADDLDAIPEEAEA